MLRRACRWRSGSDPRHPHVRSEQPSPVQRCGTAPLVAAFAYPSRTMPRSMRSSISAAPQPAPRPLAGVLPGAGGRGGRPGAGRPFPEATSAGASTRPAGAHRSPPAKPSCRPARPSSAPLRRRPPDARKGLAQEALEGAIDEPLVAGGKFRVAEAEFSSPPGAEGMALTPGRRPLSAISSAASNAHMNWLLSLPIRHGFLALQFGSVEVEHLANEHIRPVVKKELGYELLGLREVSKAGVIDEILCETIRKSEFLIADLTDDNNGVYWEAGFAEGARIPVIYICERSKFEAKKTHFDTNHRTTIMWSSGESDPFEGKLVDTIRRTVEQGSHRES